MGATDIIILKDTQDSDSKGRVIRYNVSEREKEEEIIEPFDPAYLTDEHDGVEGYVTRSEEAYFRKVARMQKALTKLHVKWTFTGNVFEFGKEVTVNKQVFWKDRIVWVDDEGDFCYGTYKECIFYGTLREVMEKVGNFLGV